MITLSGTFKACKSCDRRCQCIFSLCSRLKMHEALFRSLETRNRPPVWFRPYPCRSTINCLIAPIAFAGFRPLGHVSVQFMIVWQR